MGMAEAAGVATTVLRRLSSGTPRPPSPGVERCRLGRRGAAEERKGRFSVAAVLGMGGAAAAEAVGVVFRDEAFLVSTRKFVFFINYDLFFFLLLFNRKRGCLTCLFFVRNGANFLLLKYSFFLVIFFFL